MKKHLLTLLLIVSFGLAMQSQTYVDQFDDSVDGATFYGTGLSGSEANGEWTITSDGSSGAYTPFGLSLGGAVDITANNKIYVRAKASSLGTRFRMDVKDADGYTSNANGIVKTMISDYLVLEFDFTDNLFDGGFGGPCTTAPCPVDGSRINELIFFIDPDNGGFDGTVVLDFVAVGAEPQIGPMSDVWQDHFDNDYSLGYMNSTSEGFVNSIEDSNWKIVGNGTNVMWENVSMLFYNTTTLDTSDISVADGDNKVYLRMKSSVPGTTIRVDLQDINNFATTAGSITKTIKEADEWKTYEFNYTGSYVDLAYGGTGCTSGPCDVDATRISNMILFVNPGSEAFAGTVEIEYISIGTALETTPGEDLVLVYGDHFSDNGDFVNTTGAYGLEVANSILTATGNGVDGPYSTFAYTPHDDDTALPISINTTVNDKFFIRAKSSANNTQLRIDLVDTSGYVTSEPARSVVLSEEWATYEIEFDSYIDGGYGGAPCEMGPCNVDATAIATVLLYPNPVEGMFEGTVEIDYLSFGAPMGEDVFKYSDQFDDNDRTKWADASGFNIIEENNELVITGDGSAGPYSAFLYTPHNQDTSEDYVLNIAANNKVYMKVKSTVANVPLRLDLVDVDGFVTSEPATSRNITEEYTVLEFDFTDTYTDGGYGGTACDMGPCDVDGTQINGFLVYIDPDNGAFNGTVTIDWFSTIEPLEVINNSGPLGQDDYQDQFADNLLDFTSEADGIALVAEDGLLKMIGAGSSAEYTAINYLLHESADAVMVNGESNDNKIYVRAVTTTPGTQLRLDVVDNMNNHSSQAGLTQEVTSDFTVLEYDFTGNYIDGGYGSTGCATGPCAVDGERLSELNFYIDPGVGMFNGEVHIDWVSFGEPLMVNVIDTDVLSRAKIYPNPVTGILYLDMDSNQSGSMQASFVDVAGRTVQSTSIGNAIVGNISTAIPINGLAPGMYIIYVSINDQNAFYNKVIIK